MSLRDLLLPSRAMRSQFEDLDRRLTAAERRAVWPSALRVSVLESMDPVPSPQLMTTPGYPTSPTLATQMTLDPGRWVIASRASLSIAASDGAQVGMITRATHDGSTKSRTSTAGGLTQFPVNIGDTWTLSNALEVISATTVDVELLVYWGYAPLVDPVPYLSNGFQGASITAFPG